MTVTSSLDLADQRAALAGLRSFDATSYRVNSRGRFSTEYVDGGAVRVLVSMLTAVEIPPTDAAAFDRLAAVELPRPVGPQGRRLDQSPAAYAARVRDAALYRILHLEAQKFAALEREVMLRELAQSMRSEADQYITALEPAYSSAIADFTKLVELGFTVRSTSDDAVSMGSAAIDAWTKATIGATSSAKVLDGVAGLRIRISGALGVQPYNIEAYAGPVAYGVAFGVGDEFDRFNGWQRWLAVAATGTAQLRSVAEVDSIVAARQRAMLQARANEAAASHLSPGMVDTDEPVRTEVIGSF